MTPAEEDVSKDRRRGRALRVLIAALAAMLVGLLLLEGVREFRSPDAPAVGEPAPEFELETLEGGTIRLSDLRGKVVMASFWATWCAPCREEMPALLKVARDLGPQGLEFVAVNAGDDPQTRREDVRKFIARTDPALAQYVAFEDDEIGRDYVITSLPTLYLIDREGKVIARYPGKLSEAQLRLRLESAFD